MIPGLVAGPARLPYLPQLLALMLLGGLLFFHGLGAMGLTDRDEGRNAEAGREMFETGDWISPTFNYEPRYAKPVFLYWLMSASYRLFGVSEFAARFPSACSGVALILLQYAFLARLRGAPVGLFGALILLLNIEILGLGRMALTDSVLIFFTTLSLYGFWLGFHAEGRERHYLWLFYVGMALATLTKGPVGAAVPLLAVILYLTFTRRWGQFWQKGFPLAGTALFTILAIPWYAMMLATHGSDYLVSAKADTVGRFLNPFYGYGGTVFFYIPVLLFGFFPWSGFLPFALYQAFKDWPKKRLGALGSGQEDDQELEIFAALWVVGVFVFFSLSSTRLPHYIGPLFPAAAILTASYWNRCLVEPGIRGIQASIHTIMGLGFALALGFALLPWLYSRFIDKIAKEFPAASQLNPGDPYAGLYLAAAVLVIGMSLVGYFGLFETRRAGAFWVAGATIALVGLIALATTIPKINRYLIAPPQELAYAAGLNLEANDHLILYGPPRPSSIFYARRKAIVVHPGEEETLRANLSRPGRTMIVLPARLKSNLPGEAADYPVILDRFGYILVANEPMVKQIPSTQPSVSSRPAFSH